MKHVFILLGFSMSYLQLTSQNIDMTVKGNSEFATKLYEQVKQEPVNIIYSPFSISSALAMTYAGARGETLEQMSKALSFSKNQDELHQSFNLLNTQITKSGTEGIDIRIANSLWIEERFKVSDEFSFINQTYYNAGLFHSPFYKAPEKSRLEINSWVEKNTNNRITNLLTEGSIQNSTMLVLVNAIYFNNAWEKPFEKKYNTEDIFYIFKTCQTRATFMNNSINTDFYEDNLLSIVEIPYIEYRQSMFIFLPKENYGLKDIEKIFINNSYTGYFDKMKKKRVELSLPKFKTEATYDLKEQLIKMGMPVAFTGNADFSGISENENLFIDKVIHKAYIDVNEEGTEAAAATAVTMRKTSMMLEDAVFKADHPFIYIIKDNETNTILFIGRLMNPNQ
ncbi:MAG: hypothetical protein A2X13_07495 [Bacteroidetes bacterium GWC2_33_15]|nr:MAG: hypothetical protein A2X10_01350 [Bacteroidetes bacterium GWA2_33_15]OFX48631.1 MAG: hypothetical protein A2X13_07495 [Bacteroidetes bacterium GWC2_33_15]OFX64605.1 MAG: hypothetical protein A2X15_05085 [Bacteroidetes bacterium GWB2_32_14]OFX67977.1 MAG: hypothetical protein A2X14_01690 [Bacteroidetes bacterium GWD2_33_33]HAN18211.1 serpin family protein [Bacteroidales bacterium]